MLLVFGFCLRLSSVNIWPVQEASWLQKGPRGCLRGSLPRAASSRSMFWHLSEPQQLRGAVRCLGPFEFRPAAMLHPLRAAESSGDSSV